MRVSQAVHSFIEYQKANSKTNTVVKPIECIPKKRLTRAGSIFASIIYRFTEKIPKLKTYTAWASSTLARIIYRHTKKIPKVKKQKCGIASAI